jgi:hypothetical protein
MPTSSDDLFGNPNVGAAWQRVVAVAESAIATIARLARGFAPTQRITGAISSNVPVVSEGYIESNVEVDLEKAPEGAAYEFGSGIWGTRDKKGKYPILPKPSNPTGKLIFKWENEPVGVMLGAPHTKDGKVILKKVMHPGVVAKPYLEPAFESEAGEKFMDDIDKALMDEFAAGPDEIIVSSQVLFI